MKLDGFSRKRLGGKGSAGLTIDSIAVGTSPVISGTLRNAGGTISGITVHVFLDSIEVGTATTASNGTWSYTIVTPSNGSHAITATAAITAIAAEFDFVEGAPAYSLRLFDLSDFRNLLGL